jgi:cytosine permease
VSISAVLVPTGIADDLMGFFCDSWRIVGPVCGAMPVDYYLSRGKWSGPSVESMAKFGAQTVGFLVGIPDHLPGLPASWVKADDRSVLFSFAIGFPCTACLRSWT